MAPQRNYSSGTEKALFVLARGTCYFPECDTPVIVRVEGRQLVNVEIAHICGEREGAARYRSDMSDEERDSFDNLILLCIPHHKLVDRLDRDQYPEELLKEWKSERERDGMDSLSRVRGLTEEKLMEMLESIPFVQPQREISIELSGGVLVELDAVAKGPMEGWRNLIELNPQLVGKPLVIVVVVACQGELPIVVDSVDLYLHMSSGEHESVMSLAGRNDYPRINGLMPHRLESGGSLKWLVSFETLKVHMIDLVPVELTATEIHVEAKLATGEVIKSERCAVNSLPLELI